MNEEKKIRKLAEIIEAPSPSPEMLAAAKKEGATISSWSPDLVGEFIKGQITLGELEGISKDAQYSMAQTGHLLMTEGKYEKAARVFEGLHALDPYDAYFLTALGSIAQQQGSFDKAEKRYGRALEINPYSVPARAHRGEIRVLLGKLDEAVEDFERVAKEDPQGKDPATKRAMALAQVVMKQLQEQKEKMSGA